MEYKNCLRDLAQQVSEIAHSDEMNRRRTLWRRHNSFMGDHPLIYVRAFAVDEWFDFSSLKCTDPDLRRHEYQLRQAIWRSGLDDDWAAVSLRIEGDGPHALSWAYAKDASGSAGDDRARLADVVWLPD